MGTGGSMVRVLVVALIASVTQIALTVAYTSLTFRDELSGELALGLAAMVLGMCITATAAGVWSDLPGHVVSPQDSGPVVLSVVAPTIASTSDAPGETIVVLLGLSSIAVGLVLLVLGRSGLGRLVRFLPYPVLAGFLAGTGLVMAQGTFALASTGIGGDATGGGERLGRFAVVIAVAALMTAISRSSLPTERFLPPIVLGSIVVFHLVAAGVDLGRVDGVGRGWLLPVLPEGPLVRADTFTVAVRADWGAVGEHAPSMLPLLLLAPLTLLLYLGALEAITDREIDSDHEFQIIGASSAVAGAFGSGPAYTQFANTTLVQRMAGATRVVPIVVGLSGLVVLALGDTVVGLVPQPVVAGMLGFIAASFVLDWTWDLRGRVGPIELALTLLIAASIPLFGFLVGVGGGLALTAAWFVLQYSRISGVRRIRDARRVRSNAYRTEAEDELLVAAGGAVLIVELEGFLFFGTGDSVYRSVVEHPGADDVRHLIVDCTRVSRADSSAVVSFAQLTRWARHGGVEVTFVSMRPAVERSLSPLFDDGEAAVGTDLDRALAGVESAVLDRHAVAPIPSVMSEHAALADADRRRFDTGDELLTAGEPASGLLVVEEGRVSVIGAAPGLRLRELGPGAVLGELSLYGGSVSSATVVADEPTVARVVDADAIAELEAHDPARAAELHRWLATVIAERLLTANDALAAFHD